MPNNNVKGIKYGTWAKYNQLETKDPDTLYFITDLGGTIYKGSELVIPKNVIERVTEVTGALSTPEQEPTTYHTFEIEVFSTNTAGSQSSPSAPTKYTFNVYNKETVDVIVGVLENTMRNHRTVLRTGQGTEQDPYVYTYADGMAHNETSGNTTTEHFGHVRLTDVINENETRSSESAYIDGGGTAVTPKAVYDYVDTVIGGVGGAMVFKGTIGAAATYDSTSAYSVGDYCEHNDGATLGVRLYRCNTAIDEGGETWNSSHWTLVDRSTDELPVDGYEAGWTYRVVAPGTYAGKVCEVGDLIISINDGPSTGSTVINSDWTVAQNNIDGAVTSENELDANTLVLGNGGRTVKQLSNGYDGQYLRIVDDGQNITPEWVNHPNSDHGIAHCTCSTASTTSAKVASLTYQQDHGDAPYQLVKGSIVAVKFVNAVSPKDHNPSGNATLNVESTGAKPIIYRGSAVDDNLIKAGDTVTFIYDGTSWNFISTDKELSYDYLNNKPIHYVTNSETASTTARSVVIPDFTSNSYRLVVVKFVNGIIFDAVATPTLTVKDSNNTAIVSNKQILWHGSTITSGMIQPGDTVTMIYNLSDSFNILSIDRKIDTTPTSGSTNFVTSGGVYAAIQDAILKWEAIP